MVLLAVVALMLAPAGASAYTTTQIKGKAVSRAKQSGPVTGEPEVVTQSYAAAKAAMDGETQSIETQAQMSGPMSALMEKPVVTVHGTFTDKRAKYPRFAKAPKGTILEQVYDPETGQRLSVHLWNGVEEGGYIGGEPTAEAARRRVTAKAATWGGACSLGAGHHCYSTSEWKMSGAERVRGSESVIDTTTMWVDPRDVASRGFIDNEKWDSFQHYVNGNGPYWLETGQEGGNGVNCCQLRWFTAMNRGTGYSANESPWEQPPNSFNRYQTVSQLNNTWCFYINGNVAGCYGGFPVYADNLEVGVEAAVNYQPQNAMQEESNGTATQGNVITWKFDELWHSGGLCIGRFSRSNPPKYYPGNIVAGTC